MAKARSHAATWVMRTLVEREGAVGVAGALHWPFAFSAQHALGWDHGTRCMPCTCIVACDRDTQCRSS